MNSILERAWTRLTILFVVFALPLAIETQAQKQEMPVRLSSREAEIEEARKLMLEVVELINRGEHDAALPKATRALEMRQRIFGSDDPNVAAALNNLGYIFFKQNKDAKARELYEQALAIYENTKTENLDVVNTLSNFGYLHYRQNDRTNAEQLFTRALAMLEKLPQGTERPVAATLMSNLALVLVERRELGAAEKLFRRALSAQEKQFTPDNPALIPTLNYIVITIYQTNHVEAMKLLTRALEIVDKNFEDDPPEALPVISNLVTLYLEEGNYERAESLAHRNLALLERNPGNEPYHIALAYNSVGGFYRTKGDYKKAVSLSQRAKAILENASLMNNPYFAEVLTNLALSYLELGEYDKAEQPLERAKELRESVFGKSDANFATSLAILGDLYRRRGEYARAESMFDEALKIYQESIGQEHIYSAAVMNNLGLLYDAKGDLKRSEGLLRQALGIRERLLPADHQDIAISLVNVASCLIKDNALDEAQTLLARALPILEKSRGSNDPSVALILNALGLLHYQKGNQNERRDEWKRAESLFQQSLAIQEKRFGARSFETVNGVINLALLYQSLGDLNEAEKLYDRFLELCEQAKPQTHPAVATGLENLASFYIAKGDIARALSAMSRALEIEEYNLNLTLNSGSENQNRNYWMSLYSSTMANISLHTVAAPNNQEAARLALTTVLRRKGRVLDSITDSMQGLRERSSAADKDLLDKLAAVRRQIAASVSDSLDKPNPRFDSEALVNLEKEYQRLQSTLSAASAEFRKQSKAINVERIQKLIPKGGALIEFLSYRPFHAKTLSVGGKWGARHYIAYVLRERGDVAWTDLGEALAIDDDVWNLKIALRHPGEKNVKVLARRLDQKIMRPVRKLLRGSNWLFISPDLSLQHIPFEALVDEGGHYLTERYLFTYLTSGRDLTTFELSSPNRQPPVIVANPDFNKGLSKGKLSPTGSAVLDPALTRYRGEIYQALPETEAEADQIAKLLPHATVLRGAQATEAALGQLQGPSILHIATHGFFTKHVSGHPVDVTKIGDQVVFKPIIRNLLYEISPSSKDGLEEIRSLLQSGLVLAGANNPENQDGSDGILTAFEVGGLDLRGTKLVVLSACETGAGDVESSNGVYGLRRAFVLAGAQRLVMSLWKVDEKTTRDMMVAFYTRLRAGEGTSEALRHVRLDMLRSEKHRHPYFWASFIQSGNWRGINANLN